MPEKLNEREYRKIDISFLELRATDGNDGEKVVEGYATTFNQPYTLYDWGDYIVNEQIDSKAFDDCDMSDVIMQYDHKGRVFARISNGTLELKTDNKGLHIRANLGGTETGRQLYEEIKGGYTTKMSFGFVVGEEKREVTEDRVNNVTTVLRTITKITKLYDVSAVSLPANDATEISARSVSEGVIEDAKKELLAVKVRQRNIKRIKLLMEVENFDKT